MGSLSGNPTEVELQDMLHEVDVDGSGIIDFPAFLTLMARKMRNIDTEEELMEAMHVFDIHATGLITVSDFRYVLTNLEDITDQELDEIVRDVGVDENGNINYAN